MIQDIYPHHFLLDYTLQSPSPEDFILIFQDNQIMLTANLSYPSLKQLPASYPAEYLFLFAIDTEKFFLALPSRASALPASFPVPETFLWQPIRQLRDLRPMHLAFAGYTAWHLHTWYRDNRFCGRCGGKMEPGTEERSLVCTHCHSVLYPRINPCIIVAVHDGDRLLMTRYANRPVTWFVLIAGFIEVGETAEDTVRREVLEETGVRVKNIRYFGSQPWGIPGNLTLGFTAELDGSDEILLDTNELSEGCWFPREEVPVPKDEVSITSAMIHAFVRNEF